MLDPLQWCSTIVIDDPVNDQPQHRQLIDATSCPMSSSSRDDEYIIAPAAIGLDVVIFVRAEDGDGDEWGYCCGHDE